MNIPKSSASHQRSVSGPRLFVGIVGVLGIAGLVAALVWVLQGQVQRSEALRAQWQSGPAGARTLPVMRLESGVTSAALGAEDNRPESSSQAAILATSFSRP